MNPPSGEEKLKELRAKGLGKEEANEVMNGKLVGGLAKGDLPSPRSDPPAR